MIEMNSKKNVLLSVLFGVSLVSCTKSCAKKSARSETWDLYFNFLEPGHTGIKKEGAQLNLRSDVLTVKQGSNFLTLDVVNWDKPDFAKIRHENSIGYFKWEMSSGPRRVMQQQFSCPGTEELGVMEIEETQQIRSVSIYLENEENKTQTFQLNADVPNMSFWVKTASRPVKTCPPPVK